MFWVLLQIEMWTFTGLVRQLPCKTHPCTYICTYFITQFFLCKQRRKNIVNLEVAAGNFYRVVKIQWQNLYVHIRMLWNAGLCPLLTHFICNLLKMTLGFLSSSVCWPVLNCGVSPFLMNNIKDCCTTSKLCLVPKEMFK
jgi:hypothetical protein